MAAAAAQRRVPHLDQRVNSPTLFRKLFPRRRWAPIVEAPKDGRTVTLGWLQNGIVELEMTSRWVDGHWEGNWSPTHWRSDAAS